MHIGCWWGKPERKIPPEKPRLKWDDNIKVDLGEIELGGVD
jgi:hypothetical protein